MVEGGDFGGESSGYSTHPVTEEVGFTIWEGANQVTGTTTGWRVTAFVSSALSYKFGRVLWQQPFDAGISIWPHWFPIMRQQARSSVVIGASRATQAIVGARNDTSSKTKTPNCRSALMRFPSIPEFRDPMLIGAK